MTIKELEVQLDEARNIFNGTSEMMQIAQEMEKKSVNEHSCYTCAHRRDVYAAYQNETRIDCTINKMSGIDVVKYCKYYKHC